MLLLNLSNESCSNKIKVHRSHLNLQIAIMNKEISYSCFRLSKRGIFFVVMAIVSFILQRSKISMATPATLIEGIIILERCWKMKLLHKKNWYEWYYGKQIFVSHLVNFSLIEKENLMVFSTWVEKREYWVWSFVKWWNHAMQMTLKWSYAESGKKKEGCQPSVSKKL